MPPRALVTLRFGPYRSCGVLEHRPFRLQGLQVLLNLSQHCTMCCNKLVPSYFVKAGGQHGSVCSEWISNRVLEKHTEDIFAVLQAEGHQLILEKIPDWNNVELIVNGETVFQCNINDLDFGGDGKLDPLCEEARIAVLNAY